MVTALPRHATLAALTLLLALSTACGDGARAAADTKAAEDAVAADTADTAAPVDSGAAQDTADASPVDTGLGADTVAADTSPPTPLLAAYPLDDPLAYPESVTFDPVARAFYTGSLARGNVLRVAADGAESVFFAGNDAGEWLVLGLEADPVRRVLWVCAGRGRELTGSELWLLDLDSGARLWQLDLDTIKAGAVCIDAVVAGDGRAYIADRASGTVFRADAAARTVTVFAADPLLAPGLVGANGVAMDAQERFLLVVKFFPQGLIRVDLQNPVAVAAIDLINETNDGFRSGADAVTVLDGVVYIAVDEQLVRAVPDATWSYAHLTFHDLALPSGDPLGGVSGLTVAEGALYVSQSEVTRFAIGGEPRLPFQLLRVAPAVFGD